MVATSTTSDRTWLFVESAKMFEATAAPTPTESPTSALPEAFDRSRSLLRLLIVRSPVDIDTDAPEGTKASVLLLTMLMETAPATPTDVDALAPASASASISCSSRRKIWSAVGEVGRLTPWPNGPATEFHLWLPLLPSNLYSPALWPRPS